MRYPIFVVLCALGLATAQAAQPPVLARVAPPFSRPPSPGVRLGELRVTSSVVDGVATTELAQVVHNDGQRVGEAVWVLPLPAGATADRFSMTVNGTEVEGEVLDAQKARSTYEAIVRRQRDPGLLEYLGRGCLRARVFPIPAKGKVAVKVRYRHVLPESGGLLRWDHALRAPQVGSLRPQRTSVDLRIESRRSIVNVFSPLSGVEVVRKGDHEARVTLELDKGQLPDRDLSVYYGLSEQEFGLDLMTYRKAGEAGYFAMMLAPKQRWDESAERKKSLQLVLDTSGSMQGKKIEQARAALRFFVGSLKPTDYFNVIPFSTEARPFFEAPVPATPENVEKAQARIADIDARGGTNIEDGLLAALAAAPPADHVPMTVFLTDGRPTVGTTDIGQLVAAVAKGNGRGQRIFVLGIGDDVNTILLDSLAERTHGVRDYIAENEDIEVKTGALLTKLSHPVMTDVRLVCEGIDSEQVMPKELPDLFRGSRLLVLGRYRGHGQHAIRLRGKVADQDKEFVYEGTFPEQAGEYDFLPVLWAKRRVAILLDAIRLNGRSQELLDEVTKLGKEYGIVTPYTSHLIVEEATRLGYRVRPVGNVGPRTPGPGGPATPGRSGAPVGPATAGPTSAGATAVPVAGGGGRPAAKPEAERARERLARLGLEQSGKKAVADSKGLSASTRADSFFLGGAKRSELGVRDKLGAARLTKRVKDKTFYSDGKIWKDSAYRDALKDRIQKVTAYSAEYFELLKKHPELAPFFAIGERVLVVWKDEVFEVTAKTE